MPLWFITGETSPHLHLAKLCTSVCFTHDNNLLLLLLSPSPTWLVDLHSRFIWDYPSVSCLVSPWNALFFVVCFQLRSSPPNSHPTPPASLIRIFCLCADPDFRCFSLLNLSPPGLWLFIHNVSTSLFCHKASEILSLLLWWKTHTCVCVSQLSQYTEKCFCVQIWIFSCFMFNSSVKGRVCPEHLYIPLYIEIVFN